jgi:hypothetical protein
MTRAARPLAPGVGLTGETGVAADPETLAGAEDAATRRAGFQ